MSGLRFKLGDRVRFTGTVAKKQREGRTLYEEYPLPYQESSRLAEGSKTHWEFRRKELDSGIVIGSRHVYEYSIEYSIDYGSWDYPTTVRQVPGSGRRVWLVSYRMDRKPVMCFDHQIEFEEAEDV